MNEAIEYWVRTFADSDNMAVKVIEQIERCKGLPGSSSIEFYDFAKGYIENFKNEPEPLQYVENKWGECSFIKEPGVNYEFVMLNNCDLTQKTDTTHRKQAFVMGYKHFMFEVDNESIEVQKARVLRLLEEGVINRAVHSGNKSYHCRISITNPPRERGQYRYIWEILNKKYFNGNADKQCSYASHTTRCPNGVRLDNGKLQAAIYPDSGYSELRVNWLDGYMEMVKEDGRRRANRIAHRHIPATGKRTVRCTEALSWINGTVRIGERHETIPKLVGSLKACNYQLDEAHAIIEAAVEEDWERENLLGYADYLWGVYE